MASLDPANGDSRATRALFSLRYRLGGWFGWDDATSKLPVPGRTETTLSARVPEDLRDTTTRPVVVSSTTFIPLYRTDDEWAAELSNRTVHAVVHLAWIDQGEGVYRGQMGVYVKPRGRLRRDVHGADRAFPTPHRLSGTHAPDRTRVGGSGAV